MAQVARADQNRFVCVGEPQDVSDLCTKLIHHVAVSLLPEPAEAVEILTNLGGGEPQLCRKLGGGNARDALFPQKLEKPIVAGKPPDNGHGDVFPFWHNS